MIDDRERERERETGKEKRKWKSSETPYLMGEGQKSLPALKLRKQYFLLLLVRAHLKEGKALGSEEGNELNVDFIVST
jgi:hypothetical protein